MHMVIGLIGSYVVFVVLYYYLDKMIKNSSRHINRVAKLEAEHLKAEQLISVVREDIRKNSCRDCLSDGKEKNNLIQVNENLELTMSEKGFLICSDCWSDCVKIRDAELEELSS